MLKGQGPHEVSGTVQASVVIPTHNRKELLARVLHSYEGQKGLEDSFELVVVDDGSSDGTELLFSGLDDAVPLPRNAILNRYRSLVMQVKTGWLGCYARGESPGPDGAVFVRYVRIKKSGRSAARNIGIGFSVYPLIIFADDDIFVEPEFIRKHSSAHSRDDGLVVMGRVIHTRDLNNPFSARWKPGDINRAFLSTGNASVLKRPLVEAGLFDERYRVYGWEDFDLGIHLQENGLRSVKKRILGYHYDPPMQLLIPREVYEKEKERGQSAVYFYTSHPLRWVRRFTLVNSRILKFLFRMLGWKNWFLSRERITVMKRVFLLIIRYKGYFDGIDEGKKEY